MNFQNEGSLEKPSKIKGLAYFFGEGTCSKMLDSLLTLDNLDTYDKPKLHEKTHVPPYPSEKGWQGCNIVVVNLNQPEPPPQTGEYPAKNLLEMVDSKIEYCWKIVYSDNIVHIYYTQLECKKTWIFSTSEFTNRKKK